MTYTIFKNNESMETDRVKILKYQRIINKFFQNRCANEKEIDTALDGLMKLIQHSDQDHILAQAIRTFCDCLFLSSFFSQEDKLGFIKTLNEKAQSYGWDLNKNMIN